MAHFIKTSDNIKLATLQTHGDSPGVMWVGGYNSDMMGSKAVYLADMAARTGWALTRFDYRGHGQSEGIFTDSTIGEWLSDALMVFDTLTTGPQVLVGSSMGGWLSMLIAEKRAARVKALVLIAPAPDFPEEVYQSLDAPTRAILHETGVYNRVTPYGETLPMKMAFFKDARQHLMLNRTIQFDGPVHILQGKLDDAVPWTKAERIKSRLQSKDVRITYIEDGDHRLSRPEDLELIGETVSDIRKRVA